MKFRCYVMYLSILIAVVTILWPSKYDRIMKPILEMKEKNPNLIVDGKPEPPFPDKKKNIESITGIDVNKNGIRDDLEIYANRVSKTELERKARYQHFMALEELVKAVESKNIERIRLVDDFYAATRRCQYETISKSNGYEVANREYDYSIELFEIIQKNKNILDKISFIRAGEAQNANGVKDNVCTRDMR